jgi:hypothetical protein
MKITKALAALVATGTLALATAPAASAAAGDPSNVWNSGLSSCNVAVYYDSTHGITLYPGKATGMYTGWANHARYFRIPQGCHAQSQYSPSGSFPYQPGVSYWTNGIDLVLRSYYYA